MAYYFMLNKPRRLLSARSDASKPTVMTCFPPELQAVLHPVGRLDMDTEGLLLFTDDGSLDHHLLMPEHHVEKTYLYRSLGALTQEDMRRLETGVPILHGRAVSRPARAELLGYSTIAGSRELLPALCREKYLKNPDRPVTIGTLRVTEGRKHQIRMMLHAVGGHVFYLKRLAISGVALDPALAPGEYRALTADELAILRSAGTEPSPVRA